MEQIKIIEDLIQSFMKYPTIGRKTAERLAYSSLSLPEEALQQLTSSLSGISSLKRCPTCGYFYEDKCPFCSDKNRDQKTILVVSDIKDIITIETSEIYDGLYFALKGTISPIRNRMPNNIGILDLKARVLDHQIKEVILALPTDLDGETTSLYISKMFSKFSDITVSRIANGIPIGSSLDYLDKYTLKSSILGRTKVENIDK